MVVRSAGLRSAERDQERIDPEFGVGSRTGTADDS